MSAPLWRRIWNSIAAGTMTAADDGGSVQRHQVKIGYMELINNLPVVQHFGLASCPPLNSDVVVLFIGGDRSNGMVLGSNNQGKRPTGQAYGESQVYNAFGMSISLSKNGIVINGGGMPVRITNGDLHVDGEIVWHAASVSTHASSHEHGNGNAGTNTTAPIAGT